ncbi:E2F/DP family winged-helix DNA-binding domain-containing protein [Entamoeba marina]
MSDSVIMKIINCLYYKQKPVSIRELSDSLEIDNRRCYEVLNVLTSIPNVDNSIVERLVINGSYHFKPRYPDINIFEIDNDFFTLLHRNELFANRVALIETLLQKDISFIDLCNEVLLKDKKVDEEFHQYLHDFDMTYN